MKKFEEGRKPSQRNSAVIEIAMEPKKAELVIKAMSPEIQSLPRSNVEISRSKNGILLTISTEDTNAMRAVLNSYLRWILVAQNVMSIDS